MGRLATTLPFEIVAESRKMSILFSGIGKNILGFRWIFIRRAIRFLLELGNKSLCFWIAWLRDYVI